MSPSGTSRRLNRLGRGVLFLGAGLALFIALRLMLEHRWIASSFTSIAYLVWFTATALFGTILFRSRSLLLACSIAGSLLFIEIVMVQLVRLRGANTPRLTTTQSIPSTWIRDDMLGWRIRPNVVFSETKQSRDGSFVYKDIVYETDALGRRIDSSQPPRDAAPPYHAIFFGCSFTLGTGVPAADTLPNAFERASDGKFQSYNYGNPGYGTAHVYIESHRVELLGDIEQSNGIAVYSFIRDHLNRAVAFSIQGLKRRQPTTPRYTLRDGELLGPYFLNSRPDLQRWIRRYDSGIEISPTLRFVLPVTEIRLMSEREALDAMLELITQSKRLYDAQFSGEYFVILWPRVGIRSAQNKDVFIHELERAGIHVVAPPEPGDHAPYQLHAFDTHPSPAEYALVAEMLADRVREVFPPKTQPGDSESPVPVRIRPEVLLREGFEENAWTDVDSRLQDQPHSGRFAAELQTPGPSHVARMQSQQFPLPSEGLLTVSLWTRAIDIPGPPAGISMQALDAQGNHVSWHTIATVRRPDEGWTYHSQTIPHTNWGDRARFGRLNIMWLDDQNGVGGSMLVDDVEVLVYHNYHPWASSRTYYE